jgi:hypothetical protein
MLGEISLAGCPGAAAPVKSDTKATRPICAFCSHPFTARRTGGKPQRFCSERCRRAYERELRAWARNQIAAGGVTPPQLQRARSLRAPGSAASPK